MHPKFKKTCIFLLVLLCGLLITAYKSSGKSQHIWMQEYEPGFHRTQFVELQGRIGHQSLFRSERPPVAGQGFILEATIFRKVEHITVFLLNEKGEKISKPIMQPRNEYSYDDYYFVGTFPSQPFFITASVKFKDKPSVEQIIDPSKIVPRTDLDSFVFTFKPDINSEKFKKSLPGKSQSEKVELFSQGSCQYGQMLGYALYEGAEGYTSPSGRSDSKEKAMPVPFFYIRHSLGMGIEPNNRCYLEVLQKKNQFEEMEFITQEKHWTMKECERYEELLRTFGERTQTGNVYAFQEATCTSTGESVNLRLRIGFSQKPDFQFSVKPKIAQKPKPPVVKTTVNQVHLRELCTIKEGVLSSYKMPINLSFEQSGRTLIRLPKAREGAIIQSPDCKIISRYKKADFLNHIISLDGSSLFTKNRNYGSRYAPRKKNETFGIEKSDGAVVILTPPKHFDEKGAEYPKISVDGSAVIWRVLSTQPDRKKYDRSYLIQNLKGETLYELNFPLGELRGAPEIYMLDMKQKNFITYLQNQGLAVFDFKGKRRSDFIDIPGVGLYFTHSPHFKLFKGKNKQMNWVGWNSADMDIEKEKTFVSWNTDFGKGRHNFKPGQSISSVAVSGDGRYVAVAYLTRRDRMTGRQDYMFTLLATGNGKQVYTKKLGNEGPIEHQVAFLKNNYVAYNRFPGHHMATYVVLFKIEKKK